MSAITSREQLIRDVADALNNGMDSISWCLDLTSGEIIPLFDPLLADNDECMPAEGHRLINIESLTSRESFEIMENFVLGRPEAELRDSLCRALRQRHPFSAFRNAVFWFGIRKEWLAFRDEALQKTAVEWLELHGVDVLNEKVVCTDEAEAYIWRRELSGKEDFR